MSEPLLGEIRIFAGNFAPRSYAFCNGLLLAVANNESLFSLLGAVYGGDGRTTFAIPDLRGRIPVHRGRGPGLRERNQGQRFGLETVKLSTQHLPSHNHPLQASTNQAAADNPAGMVTGTPSFSFYDDAHQSIDIQQMSNQALGSAGGNIAHNNLMPYLCVNFIIALKGIYPSRN